MTPVLLLDVAAGFRGMAADSLRVAGFEPTGGRHTVAEAEALVLRGPVRSEALVLDVNLPDGGGCALCARLRAVRQRMPVLMLAGPGAEGDVVRGLEADAHDSLNKPIRPSEPVAHLRHHENGTDTVFTAGRWRSTRPRRGCDQAGLRDLAGASGCHPGWWALGAT